MPNPKSDQNDVLDPKKARQQEVGSRLRTFREESGFSFAQLEGLSGVPISTLKKVEGGHSLPGGETLIGLLNAGINSNWLLSGQGRMTIKGLRGLGLDHFDKGIYAFIPKLPIEVSTGDGASPQQEESAGELAFRRNWLYEEGLSENNLRIITSKGDSMVPTIPEDSTLLVDVSKNEFIREGVYVIRIDNLLYAKRLQRGQSGNIHVISDNPLYKQFTIEPEHAELQIIGKVVWLGHTM